MRVARGTTNKVRKWQWGRDLGGAVNMLASSRQIEARCTHNIGDGRVAPTRRGLNDQGAIHVDGPCHYL